VIDDAGNTPDAVSPRGRQKKNRPRDDVTEWNVIPDGGPMIVDIPNQIPWSRIANWLVMMS